MDIQYSMLCLSQKVSSGLEKAEYRVCFTPQQGVEEVGETSA